MHQLMNCNKYLLRVPVYSDIVLKLKCVHQLLINVNYVVFIDLINFVVLVLMKCIKQSLICLKDTYSVLCLYGVKENRSGHWRWGHWGSGHLRSCPDGQEGSCTVLHWYLILKSRECIMLEYATLSIWRDAFKIY